MTKEQLIQLANMLPSGAEVQLSINISDPNDDSEDRVFVDEFDEIKRISGNKFVICAKASGYNF